MVLVRVCVLCSSFFQIGASSDRPVLDELMHSARMSPACPHLRAEAFGMGVAEVVFQKHPGLGMAVWST